jgi:hypothetical protein
MRPILNLKKLNAVHLDNPYFRMETTKDVRHVLRPEDWAASIDLKDAYFHVPLYHSTKKYVFWVEGPSLLLMRSPFWDSRQLRRSSRLSPDSSRCISGQGPRVGVARSHPSLVCCLGHTARGILNYSLVAFLRCFGLSAAQGRN